MDADAMPRGLYLLTPDEPDTARLLERVAPLLPFATWLQYRSRRADAAWRERRATARRRWCRDAGVPLLVNDDAALAARVSADGVHLGEGDGAIAAARALLGAGAIIGASCYDDPARAARAAAAG